MTAPRIVVLGSLTMDLVFRIPRFPAPGETLFADGLDVLDGGKGLNQAVAAARLGAGVVLLGRVGADPFGERLVALARAEGVDVSGVAVAPGERTGLAAPVVLPGGENSILAAPGANLEARASDIHAARRLFDGASALLVQFETSMESVVEAAQLARGAGATVILNPAPVQPFPEGLADIVDIVVMNEVEAAMLAHGSHEPAGQALELARGRKAAVVTLGPAGGLLAEEGVVTPFAALPVTAVDTVGAGDAFCGALAVALGEGRPLARAVRFASAAAALSVTRAGAAPSLPTRAEVEALLAR